MNKIVLVLGLLPLLFFYGQNAYGAEIAHFFDESTTCTLANSVSFQDHVTVTNAEFDFIINRKYLIVATANLGVEGANDNGELALRHGTTTFADSLLNMEPSSASGATCGADDNMASWAYFTVWNPTTSGEASEDIHISFREIVSGDEVFIDQATIFVMEISEDLTENTDWFHDTGGADTNLGTAWDSADDATVTFTPTAGNDWLVMATAHLDPDGATRQLETRIFMDSGTNQIWSQEGEDASSDQMVQTLFRVFNLDGTSHTIETESQAEVNNAGERDSSTVFVINLDKFETDNSFFEETEEILGATLAEVYTLSHTPDTASLDHWIMAMLVNDDNDGVGVDNMILQVDNVDQPATQTSDSYQLMDSWDATGEIPWHMQTVESLTASAHNLDVDGSDQLPIASRVEDKVLFAVSMNLDPPVVVYDVNEMDVYKSSSTTLDSGVPVCLDVLIASGGTCNAILTSGETYRFEFRVENTGNISGSPNNFEFRSTVASGDVLGTILTGDLGGGGCGSNSDWTDTVVTTRVDWNSGTVCAISASATEEYFVIVTIDTDADEGTATAFVDDGTVTDESGTITFQLTGGEITQNTGCCLFFIMPLMDFIDTISRILVL